jgi:hypothetical protein
MIYSDNPSVQSIIENLDERPLQDSKREQNSREQNSREQNSREQNSIDAVIAAQNERKRVSEQWDEILELNSKGSKELAIANVCIGIMRTLVNRM